MIVTIYLHPFSPSITSEDPICIVVNDDIQNGDDDHQIVHWPGARRREEAPGRERGGGP